MRRHAALVLAIAAMVTVAGCGGNPSGSSAPTTAASTVPIDAVVDDGTAIAEVGRAATSEPGSSGGSISATGSNGLTYSITIPTGSRVQPVAITITPIRELRGLEGGPPVIAAARLEPAGTVLAAPLDLAIPYAGTPGPGEIVYAVISSDGGNSWDAIPARMDAGVAHVDVFHFSHIALVAGQFSQQGLIYLTQTSSGTDVLRRRVATAAVGRAGEEAAPLVRPILKEWLLFLRDQASEHASVPADDVDAAAVLRDASDRIAMHKMITETVDGLLTRGELDALLFETELAELLASVDLYLGTGMAHAFERAANECAVETERQLRLALVYEQVGWEQISVYLGLAVAFESDEPFVVDPSYVEAHLCPRVDLELVQLGPKPIKQGDTPRVTGQIRLLQSPGAFLTPDQLLPTSRFTVTIASTGLDGQSEITVETDGNGQLDVALPPVAAGDISVTLRACITGSGDWLAAMCGGTTLRAGQEPAVDLSGTWSGTLSGGNLASDAQMDYRFTRSYEESDGSRSYVEQGATTPLHMTDVPDPFRPNMQNTLEIRVYPDGRLRATLGYEISPDEPTACEGIMVGDGTLTAQGDRMTFQFNGQTCLLGAFTLDFAKIY